MSVPTGERTPQAPAPARHPDARERRSPARTAVGDVASVAAGVAPFGMLVGVATAAAGLHGALGLVGSGLVYAGTAQLTAVSMTAAGAGVASVMLAVAVVNARLLVYGAALQPLFAGQPGWFRWLAPHVIVDQTYLAAAARPELARRPQVFRRYWLWLGAALGVVWLGSVAVGMALGPVLPESFPLRFAATAAFIGLLVPRLSSRPALVAALTGGAASAAAAVLPQGTGVLVGAAAGVVAGAMTSRRRSRR